MAYYKERLSDIMDPVQTDMYLEMDGRQPTLVYKSTQEMDPILEEVTRLSHQQEMAARPLDPGRFKIAAKIPLILYFQWKQEWLSGPCNDMSWTQFELMKLNSREFSKWRVGGKKI